MKRLIVCCDGTWNTPDQEDNGIPVPTNVFKIYNAIADRDPESSVEQLRYYNPGVGSSGGVPGRVLGGAVGLGTSKNIRSAYHWLGCNYEEGDEIYLFGFSRGVFAVRSLGGFLARGLLNLRGLESKETWQRVKQAFSKGYRKKKSKVSDWAGEEWSFFHGAAPLPITFMGVWETVGALGVPDDLEIFNIVESRKSWSFHDTELGNHVRSARHAMAIDEIRSSFCVSRWSNGTAHPGAKELWFPGVHSDVGGGYGECGLSNGVLLWMIEESAAEGLAFREKVAFAIEADPLGVMHNSFKGASARLRSRPRNVDAIIPENSEFFHQSVFERQEVSPNEYPGYHPTRILESGESCTVEVFADTRWNDTGLFLVPGRYVFSATGEWQDLKDTCDWRGTEDGKLTVGDVVRATSSFLGSFEGLFRKITKNESTDFLGTKRVERLNWCVLIGAIANDGGAKKAVGNDGSPVPHQYVALPDYTDKSYADIGNKCGELNVSKPGYLYCFPNDVWTLYGNNHGSVHLTVSRVS